LEIEIHDSLRRRFLHLRDADVSTRDQFGQVGNGSRFACRGVYDVELDGFSVNKWASLVGESQADGAVRIMDGQLFHGDFTNLFLMEADSATLASYVQAVATKIASLNPLLVYF
jgi:hypothetical protein